MKYYNLIIYQLPKILSFLLLSILIIGFIYPIIPLLLSIFTPTTENFRHLIKYYLVENTLTTLGLIFFTGIFSILISFSTAFLVSFYQFPGSNIFKFLHILPITIPTYFGAYIYDKIFDYSGIINSSMRNTFSISHFLSMDLFSFWGGVFIFTLFLYPYLFILLLSFFKKNITELLEVSRTLGSSILKTITIIILPLSKIPILAGITMISMEIISDFGVSSYLGLQTFSTTIFKAWFGMNDITLASKLSAYLIPIIFILLILTKKYSTQKPLTIISYKNPSPIPLTGIQAFLAIAYCCIIFIISYLLPVLILIYYGYFAFQDFIPWDIFSLVFQTVSLMTITCILLLIFGIYFAYHNRRKSYFYSEIFALQYAIPSIMIAVSILLSFFQLEKWNIIPIGTTISLQNFFILLIFGYIIRFMILSYNISFGAFKKIGLNYQEISRTLGYSPIQSFFKLELPMILPNIILGSSIIMIDLFKELPITLFLRPLNFNTPTTYTYDYVVNEMFTESTPYALVLIALIGVIIYILFHYSNKYKGE